METKVVDYKDQYISSTLIAVKIQNIDSLIKERTEEKEHYARQAEWNIVKAHKDTISKLILERNIYEKLLSESKDINDIGD